jgi:hypothetical protein
MALTAGHAAYAALHEDGINKFIRNVFLVSPHYFHYATSMFGGGAINISLLSPLEVPGVGNVIQYSIDIGQPVIDLVPQDAGSTLSAPLAPGPNQFSLTAEVRICIACGQFDKRGHRDPKRFSTILHIWAIGYPTIQPMSVTGKPDDLRIDQIVVKNICDLEQIVECLPELTVNALLERLQQKVSELVLGAFGLILAADLEISDDQLNVWGISFYHRAKASN